MANWESIGDNGHMCPKYSQWVTRSPGAHPCTFTETFAGEVQDSEDGTYTEIQTLRCPLAIIVSDKIDPLASKSVSRMHGESREVRASIIMGQEIEKLQPDMGNGCIWGDRGERPFLTYPQGY